MNNFADLYQTAVRDAQEEKADDFLVIPEGIEEATRRFAPQVWEVDPDDDLPF